VSEGAVKKRIGWLGWTLRALAVGYPVALLGVALLLRFVGEQWWVTAAALYLPRIGFGLPMPVLTLALLIWGPRRLLFAQVLALGLLLFPVMGLELHRGGATPRAGALRLRLVTYNVATGSHGNEGLLATLHDIDADLILLQETHPGQYATLTAGLEGYQVRISDQFLLASRFPIEDLVVPPRILHSGMTRSPRFVRYRVRTPQGLVQIYNVHPISPREALDELRDEGRAHEVVGGEPFRGPGPSMLMENASLRLGQLQAMASDARRSPYPVIIAGDTNLPGASWALAHWLGDFRDGFSSAGWGFGYTFPAPRHPWMRIDRVLVDARVSFLRFEVIRSPASDHYPVVADLELLATH